MINISLSALELPPIEAGTWAEAALQHAAEVAGRLEGFGYNRIWYAEHHHSPSFGPFPPVVMTAHAAASTSFIRVGSGGVLVPNHSPIVLAEQFGTLASLHAGRIDLGIGRGPGTFDEATAQALRRGAGEMTSQQYRADVLAVLHFLTDEVSLRPLPEPWLLSSSTAGAVLAAEIGLPLTFAHHISPDNISPALDVYRRDFSPSVWCRRPRVLICVEVVCAETQGEADWLASPMKVIKEGFLKGRGDIRFPTPEEASAHVFTSGEWQKLLSFYAQQACGPPETVSRRLSELAAATSADEIMLVTPISTLADRLRSYELIGQIIEK
ncbi:LLM class flavin-dependent oxidoreductase [Streptomyces sp. NPDC088748]|uniref:LLM class flavin-dependent oxidoreductase n=1 Tax=Streptomyces sp. NPDC088748 TaxID=3365887 RepID=UPI00380D472F